MSIVAILEFAAACLAPSAAMAWALGYLVRRWAPRWGLVDQPGHRKVHATPTPLGGGLAIWGGVVGAFFVGTAVLLLAPDHWLQTWLPDSLAPHVPGVRARLPDLWVLLSAGSLLMVLGLVDDQRGLHWTLRIGLQFAVAIVCVFFQGWRLTAFIPLPALAGFLSVVWIVTLVNSFNMLDNMDGLSAGVAAISASILALFLLLPQGGPAPQLFVAGFLLVVVGGLLGFLWHNRTPARLFMGDAGSYFVGFCIAVCTLLATYTGYNSETRHAVLAPLCVMAVPLYDLVTVLSIRIREGRSPFEGDKSHFSHRLVELGLTKPQAVSTIYLTSATCGLAALLLHQTDRIGAAVLVSMVICILRLIHILETAARRKG